MALRLAEATATLTEPGQMFEVAEEEIDGVMTRAWRHCPPSLRFILELSRGHGDATFLVYEDDRMTFKQHFEEVAALSTVLADRYGVGPGDRVAIAMRNYPEWVVAFWSGAALGAVLVPLNAWWTGPELAFGLEDSGAKVAFLDGERLDRLASHLEHLRSGGLETVILARSGEGPSAVAVPAGVERYESVLAGGDRSVELPAADVSPDDNATIFYTSGTTGRPKGALGTQRNICTNLMSLAFINARNQLVASDAQLQAMSSGGGQNSHLLSVPLFHATGCHTILVGNTAVGGKLVMMRRWDPERALELIEREHITVFGGVPTMAWQILNSPDFDKRDTSSVRTVGYGGAPAPPELLRRIKHHFPLGNASNGYGLTETSAVTSMNSGDDYVRRPDSVGPPVPICEVRIVDAAGAEAPPGAPGRAVGEGGERRPGVLERPRGDSGQLHRRLAAHR